VVSAHNRGSPNSTTWFGDVTVVIKKHQMPGSGHLTTVWTVFWECATQLILNSFWDHS
jgi:hypothetical protein